MDDATTNGWHTRYDLPEKSTCACDSKKIVIRNGMSPHERLAVTLRFLVTGRSCEDLQFSAIISPQALIAIMSIKSSSTFLDESDDAIFYHGFDSSFCDGVSYFKVVQIDVSRNPDQNNFVPVPEVFIKLQTSFK